MPHRFVNTAITRTIRMLARLMATGVPIGSLAACLLALVPGTASTTCIRVIGVAITGASTDMADGTPVTGTDTRISAPATSVNVVGTFVVETVDLPKVHAAFGTRIRATHVIVVLATAIRISSRIIPVDARSAVEVSMAADHGVLVATADAVNQIEIEPQEKPAGSQYCQPRLFSMKLVLKIKSCWRGLQTPIPAS